MVDFASLTLVWQISLSNTDLMRVNPVKGTPECWPPNFLLDFIYNAGYPLTKPTLKKNDIWALVIVAITIEFPKCFFFFATFYFKNIGIFH